MHTSAPPLHTGSTIQRLRRFEQRAGADQRTVEAVAREGGASCALLALACALDRARAIEEQARQLGWSYDAARELREGALYLAACYDMQPRPVEV